MATNTAKPQWLSYSGQATDEWSGGIATFSNGDLATAFSVSKSNGASSVIVQRLGKDGAVVWSLDIGADYAPGAGSVLVGADDKVYVTGGTKKGASGESGLNDSDIFAAAVSGSGQKLWYKNYGIGIHEIGSTGVLDANGNILLEGRVSEVNDGYAFIKDVPNFYGAEFSGGWRGFQLKINPVDGTVTKAYTTGSGNSGGGPIAIDRSRNIAFVSGYTFGAVNGVNTVGNGDPNGANTYLIARNENTGAVLWTRMENWMRSNLVCQESENAVYLVNKGKLEKIDSSTGQIAWSKTLTDTNYLLAPIKGGGVLLSESESNGTLTIRRFDASGTEKGSQTISHTGKLYPRSFIEQGDGTIQISGSTSGTITNLPTGATIPSGKQAGTDSFILQINSAFSVAPKDVTTVVRGNSLYTIVDGPSWTQAEANSVKLGGHLASIGSFEEDVLLWSTFKNQELSPDGLNWGYWIGLNRENNSNMNDWLNWKWISGENKTTYQNKHFVPGKTGEPNGGSSDLYVHVWGERSNIFEPLWNDATNIGNPGTNSHPYVGITETPFIRRGDSAYVIVQGPTWEEAEANAVKLGGHLVTINDAAENDWIRTNYSSTNSSVWIGFNDKAKEGTWIWSSGDSVAFTSWNSGEPDGQSNYKSTENAAHLVLTGGIAGKWQDIPNNSSLVGLAEIKLAPNNKSTGTPSVTGTLKAGSTLTIDASAIKDADNFTGYTPNYQYNWEVSSDNGTTWSKLTSTDATDNNTTYTLTSAEVGKQVRSVVSYLDGYGTNEVVNSAASTTVANNLTVRGNSLYTIVDGPSWTQAEANSVKLGGHLITIGGDEENRYVASAFNPEQIRAIQSKEGDQAGGPQYWIGITDKQEEGKWIWVSGEPASFTKWASPTHANSAQQPDNYLDQDYGVLNWTSFDTWDDERSDGSTSGAPLDLKNGIAETPFIRRGDSAYVIVQGPTWEEAEANAVKLGGHLVTINDAAENDWIRTNYSSTNSSVWIGFNDKAKEGTWIWSSGDSVAFTSWNSGEPDGQSNYKSTENAAHLVLTGGIAGKWQDIPNNSSLVGLAEIKLAPNNKSTGTPSVTGTLKAGSTLTIDASAIKDADNFTGYTPNYQYNWEVSSDNGTTWSKLTSTDATDNNTTYTLTSAEVGKQVRSVVSYLDGYGTNEVVNSAASTTVANNLTVRGNSLYTIVDGPSWTQAEANSVKLGGHLIEINSKEENDLAGEIGMGSGFNIWIGASDPDRDNIWNWTTGNRVSYSNWGDWNADGQRDGPNRISTVAGNEDYASIILSSDPKVYTFGPYVWNDLPNHSELLPWQEWRSLKGIAEIPFVRRGDSAYVVVQGPTWEEAEANAVKLGGHLVTINDAAENAFVTDYIKDQKDLSLFIGATDKDKEGVWTDPLGNRLTYTNWDTWTTGSEPNGGINENYGVIYPDSSDTGWSRKPGKWNDAPNIKEITKGIAEIKLAPNNAPTGSPSVTGTLKAGSTLTIDASAIKDADNFTGYTPNYQYSWEVSTDGKTWSKLTSADATDNNTTYTLTTAESGRMIRGVMSYVDGYGTQESVASVGTAVITGAPTPTYTLTPSVATINEGSTLTTTVATTNVASGTTLYWALSGTGITTADFSAGALAGSGTVGSDGKFSFSHTLASDQLTEGTETLEIKLFSDSSRTVQVGAAATVSVSDTSTTPAPTPTGGTIESIGRTILRKLSTGQYVVQGIEPGSAQLAISKDGTQIYEGIYGKDWTVLAAELVNGVNQVLWRNSTANRLHVWSCDATWTWQSSSGWDEPASAVGQQLESLFGIDLDGNGTVATIKQVVEEAGSVRLTLNDGKYWAEAIAAGAAAAAIRNGGVQIYAGIYGSQWQVQAAETVNGVNQVLWRETSINKLHLWSCDASWNRTSSGGLIDPASTEAQQLEASFGLDLNGDGVIAAASTAVETAGVVQLLKGSGNRYSAQSSTPGAAAVAIKKDGVQIYAGIYGADWQLLAAEQVNGVNQVLWKNSTANRLHVWSCDATWTWQSSAGWDETSSSRAIELEGQFGIDLNGDGTVAQPSSAVDEQGSVWLIKGAGNSYSARTTAAGATPVAIKKDGVQISQGIYGADWQVLAAETVNGVNQLLWKNTGANRLHVWTLDGNWAWKSSSGWDEPGSAVGQQLEAAFGLDLNGDGVVAAAAVTVENKGVISLISTGATGVYSALQSTSAGSTPVAIKKDGVQISKGIYGSDWQVLAAETVNGSNQVLWKNSAANRLHVWSCDGTWAWTSSTGWDEPNSAAGQQLEAAFGLDLDGNGVVASPETTLEGLGAIRLISSGSNRAYSAIANAPGSTAAAIKKDGVQIYGGIYGADWQVLAAETVNGSNQVLWKNSAANRLHVWTLDANWAWTSSTGWDEPNSAAGQQLEAAFGLDLDGNGTVAAPSATSVTIESKGEISLLKGSGGRYSAQSSTPGAAAVAISNGGTQIYEGIYGAEWQVLAADSIGGVNQVLWKNTTANRLHTWSLDASWSRSSSSGLIDPAGHQAKALEAQFGVDLNGDGRVLSYRAGTFTADVITGSGGSSFFSPLGVGSAFPSGGGVDQIISGGGRNQLLLADLSKGGNLYSSGGAADYLQIDGFDASSDQLLVATGKAYGSGPLTIGSASGIALYEDRNADGLYSSSSDELLAFLRGSSSLPSTAILLG